MEENRDIKHLPACCVCSRQYEMNDTSIDVIINMNTNVNTNVNTNANANVNTNFNTNINTNIDIFINEQMMNNLKTAAVTMALVNLA